MAIPSRLARPAMGADFDGDRLRLAIENCGLICHVLQSEGLRPGSSRPLSSGATPTGGLHIKDVFPDHLDAEQSAPRSYHELAAAKRLSCEPGLGVVDFDAVLAVLPDDYDGDFMIEIDEPSVDSRFESHRISYEWARHNLPVSS